MLYVFTTASKISGSVQKKVCDQIDALIANGIDCRGLFLSTDKVENAETYPNVDFVLVPKVQSKYFRASKQKTTYFKALIYQKTIDFNSFDYVYFRYPGAHYLLNRWIRSVKTKVFF